MSIEKTYVENGLKSDIKEIKSDVNKLKITHEVLTTKFDNHLINHKSTKDWIQWMPGVLMGIIALVVSVINHIK